MADDRTIIDVTVVRRLIEAQFPEWRHLPIAPVEHDGWDNRTFRLGDELSVRLPSAPGYAPQVAKEVAALAHIAAGVSIPVPEIVGVGEADEGYPFPWTVRRWLTGIPASHAASIDLERLAADVAEFLTELARVEPLAEFAPGPHSADRGGPVTRWDAEVRATIPRLGARVDAREALRVWDDACAAPATSQPHWVHGDIAADNLLVRDGRLAAVIDFGCAAVGDGACDLAIAWDLFDERARTRFLQDLDADEAMRARGAGWALWKALITFGEPARTVQSTRTLAELGVA